MIIIENEAKKHREYFITKHLMELNKDNDTVAIQVDDRNVFVSFLKKNGVIYLKPYKRITYEENLADKRYCLCEYYTNNGTYFLHLDTMNPCVTVDVKEHD